MTIANADIPCGNGWIVQAHDIGQADAYSIITPNEWIMIDVGDDQIVNAFDTHDSRTIDHLVTTHIHDAHVAGLRHLNDKGYSINQVYRPNATRAEVGNETGYVNPIILDEYFENLSKLGIEFNEANPVGTGEDILDTETEGSSLSVLSPPVTGDVLNPKNQSTGYQCKFKPEKANPNSVVCKFGGLNGISGLFMGDVGDEDAHYAESWLLEQHVDPESEVDLDATVLFLGSHGSENSTGMKFLDAVAPDHVVISSSSLNDYTTRENQHDGHPHDETLERLHERDVAVHWIAVHGSVRTVVEDGTVQIEHTTGIETTAAADLAALKYFSCANDLDQEQLAAIEEIAAADLPDEAPAWVKEAAIVTEPSQIPEKTDEQKDKIDTLHALEVKHRSLTKRKDLLEQEREQLTEEKNALEEERDATSGLWDRFTTSVTEGADTETTQDDSVPVETKLDDTIDTDSRPYQQADDIDEAIEILERKNAHLEAAIKTLTQTTETLQTDIKEIEQQLTASSGLRDRLSHVITPLTRTEADEQPHVIRQPRFSGAMVSAAGKTDKKTANDTSTPVRSQTNDDRSTRKSRLDLIEKTRNATTEPTSTDAEQD